MSGVTIGRVESIAYDFNEYRARVTSHRASYDRIPDDSDAGILTAGLSAAIHRNRARKLGNLFKDGDE